MDPMLTSSVLIIKKPIFAKISLLVLKNARVIPQRIGGQQAFTVGFDGQQAFDQRHQLRIASEQFQVRDSLLHPEVDTVIGGI
jgi:hypothetical protein